MPERRQLARRALPRRFRRPRLLLLGCGDVGLRIARLVAARARVFGVVRRQDAAASVRASGAVPIVADLDARGASDRLARLATRVVHLAPPPAQGPQDPRTRRALTRLLRPQGASMVARGLSCALGPTAPDRWVYVSTTGVYGDRAGGWVDERTPPAPTSDRARRRVHAERTLRGAAARGSIRLAVLRAPGIYAADRLPLDRIRAGTPALRDEDDGWTNHVHADDLARACWVASLRAASPRTFDAVDASRMKMGQWFDLVADAHGLPRPPRVPRQEIARHVSPAMLSFMQESRRIRGERMGRELRLRLRYPTVRALLKP